MSRPRARVVAQALRPAWVAISTATPASLWEAVRAAASAERDRWVLWLPVALGLGVAIYFELPVEPAVWLSATWLAISLGIAAASWRFDSIRPFAVGLAAMSLGLCLATWRADRIATVQLDRSIGPAPVEGRVVEINKLPEGYRLVLDTVRLDRVAAAGTPQRVRVSVTRPGEAKVAVGDRISVMAMLSPPSGPAEPGAFDFQRMAWFMRVGAVGYAVAPPRVTEAGVPSGAAMWLDRLRRNLADRIMAALPPREGAIAAALLTGEQSGIDKEAMAAMRDSGLAHLLSISGLHMALVGALLMGIVRYGLAAIPWIALRFPIKKWAAAAALFGSFGYLLLAGAPVPAQRSFFMMAMVLVAILLDRSALTMRLVAWAAAAVLLIEPESILGASFQLSFAAVVALIAGWESVRPLRERWNAYYAGMQDTLWARAVLYLGGVLFTTLIASFATAAFSAFHFNRLGLFGIAANLLAVPLTSLWVMPFGVLAFLLMPLGLEQLALVPMGWGIDGTVRIAQWVSSWPGAAALYPSMPTVSLWMMTLGGLWVCFWRRAWRWLGVVPFAVALSLAFVGRPPDIHVHEDGRVVGLRNARGDLYIVGGRPQGFAPETWARRGGGDVLQPPERAQRQARGTRLQPPPEGAPVCDRDVCWWRKAGWRVAVVQRADGIAAACAGAEIVVSREPLRERCASARHLVDRLDAWRDGAHALWIEPGGVRIETARERRGERPWVPKPERRGN